MEKWKEYERLKKELEKKQLKAVEYQLEVKRIAKGLNI